MPLNGVQIGGGFSEGELEFASYWVKNRIAIRRAGYASMIAVNVFLWLYISWGILDAYAISYPRESRMSSEIANNQLTLEALEVNRPRNIQTGGVVVFESTDGRYDMGVDVENVNPQWWAEFNYRFNLSGQPTPMRSGYIMPQTRSVLTELGYKPKTKGGLSAQFVIENIRWHRVDPNQVGELYKNFELERFNLAVTNIKFQNDLVIGTKKIGRTFFDIVNHGSYGYWSMDFIVKLYRGSTVAGINKVNLTNIVPGETRTVEIDWFEKLPSTITKTEVIPVMNFLDEKNYLPTQKF